MNSTTGTILAITSILALSLVVIWIADYIGKIKVTPNLTVWYAMGCIFITIYLLLKLIGPMLEVLDWYDYPIIAVLLYFILSIRNFELKRKKS